MSIFKCKPCESQNPDDGMTVKKKKPVITVAVLAICACIVLAAVLTTVIIWNGKYNAAISLMNDKNYDEAIMAFESLGGYKDSQNRLENCYTEKYGEEKWNKLKNIKVGDTYTFGAYEQDLDDSDGKEAIEWIVLEKKGMSLFLISKQGLDNQQYDTSNADELTWESCSLRKWLNSTFLSNAFSVEEQAQIQNTVISAEKSSPFLTNTDDTITDKVFLLSITEADTYFSSDSERTCKPTMHALYREAYVNSDTDNCIWSLRLPVSHRYYAACVTQDGAIYCLDKNFYGGTACVRPALWINLDS